jgi:hypothetical protein
MKDVDDLAVIMWGRIKELRSKSAAEKGIPPAQFISWPVGICKGKVFKMIDYPNQWMNIAVTSGGILLINAKEKDYWIASYPTDSVQLVII